MPMLDAFMPLPPAIRAASIAALLLGTERTREGWPTEAMVRGVAKLFDVDPDPVLAVFGYVTVIHGRGTHVIDLSQEGNPKSHWAVPDVIRQPFEVFRNLAAMEPGRSVGPLYGHAARA